MDTGSTLTRCEVSPAWARLLKLLPGYDPFLQAEECEFDDGAALRVIHFFARRLRHVKGKQAGKRFKLEPWQTAFIANLFGWKRPDGTRRYREALLYVAKKNGKTALAAGLILYMLGFDGELGAEVYSAAASRDQASLVFQHASGMVRLEPKLKELFRVYGDKGGSQQKAIVQYERNSSYKCLAADADTVDGINPHFNAIDELHRHPKPELTEVLKKSTAARGQPITLYTTTADYNRPSLCNTMLNYARQVRDNKGSPDGMGWNPSFLPAIYEASREDDWKAPATWRKANPNLGVTVNEEFLQNECRQALDKPSELNNFLRLHLNIVTDADVAWLDMASWAKCGTPFDLDELADEPCFGGLDLASTTDLAAFALYWPSCHALKLHFWVPRENAKKREERDRVPYLQWAREGFITLTEGDVIDYGFIRKFVNDWASRLHLESLAYDPWNAQQIALDLKDSDGLPMVEFRQGYKSMNEPTKEFERLVVSGALRHGNNPVLAWNAGNVMVRLDPAGNVKPDKSKSNGRIDGIVASIMALGTAMVRSRVDTSPGLFFLGGDE